MAIDEKIRGEKLQHNVLREAAEVSSQKLINVNILQVKKY